MRLRQWSQEVVDPFLVDSFVGSTRNGPTMRVVDSIQVDVPVESTGVESTGV